MGKRNNSQREYLGEKFGNRVSFRRTERKLYGHDVSAMPGLIKPLVTQPMINYLTGKGK